MAGHRKTRKKGGGETVPSGGGKGGEPWSQREEASIFCLLQDNIRFKGKNSRNSSLYSGKDSMECLSSVRKMTANQLGLVIMNIIKMKGAFLFVLLVYYKPIPYYS